jgi:hypothetical protein
VTAIALLTKAEVHPVAALLSVSGPTLKVTIPARPRRRTLKQSPGCNLPVSPAAARQWPVRPNAALIDEFSERQLGEYIGHWARKVPAAGVGRERQFDSPARSRSSNASCWLASPIVEGLQWRFHPRACAGELWPLHLGSGHSRRECFDT